MGHSTEAYARKKSAGRMTHVSTFSSKYLYFAAITLISKSPMKKNLLVLLFLVSFTPLIYGQIRLPRVIGDHMVIQRDKDVKIWGWAKPGESVQVSFNGQQAKAKASKSGTWMVMLKPMKHGGPFEMKVSGKSNSITLRNILIGDVWLGSGQSNMEWSLRNTSDAAKDIPVANHPNIRLFTIEKDMSFTVLPDAKTGEWVECTPASAAQFSAVAYYFGVTLHKELNVPIGLIHSSWGGTKVEPWMSWDLMSMEQEYQTLDIAELESTAADDENKRQKFQAALQNDKGVSERWFAPEMDVSAWKTMKLPMDWTRSELGDTDGIVYFRKEFELKAVPEDATLSLGPIDDNETTWINGTQVGATNGYNIDRVYAIRPGVLKVGKNVVVVKVTDTGGGGGLNGKPEQVYLYAGDKKVDLSGDWKYKASVLNADFGILVAGPNAYPSRLYNAMIAPVIPFSIRGVIWYQGESNTGAAFEYRRLFPMLIKNWRAKWGYEFPFYWVQLANFMAEDSQPSESTWAELREAQSMTLSLPKTGQAVTIDIGEANDIHPRNKKDVGYRLALNALAGEYNRNIVYSGPVYKSLVISNDKAVVSFNHTGGGLMLQDKYGYLKGFAIAGEDKKFYWAKGHIEGDKVVLYSEQVKKPVAVRYAWGHNPEDANLFNREGLPASPFRTDDWKITTQK